MLQISQTALKNEKTKLNTDIKWSASFKKIQRVREIKLKWLEIIRLVHRILGTNVALMRMSVNDFDSSFCKKTRKKSEIVLIIFLGDNQLCKTILGTIPDSG